MVNNILGTALEGLFPNHCVLCGLRSCRELPLCPDCQQDLRANHSCCQRCAIPLPTQGAAGEPRVCGSCLRQPPPFERVIAPWLYDEYMAHLIHRWKFGRERRLTQLLAFLWLQQSGSPRPPDLLVPVPLHWSRLWQRGFNQSELLCREIRGRCPALARTPLEPRAVRRRRATRAQSGMSARQRAGNLRDAFTVKQPCDNLRIAIVDDVLTTGVTAAALSRVLSAAGAIRVEIWCLARTPAPGP